MNVKQLFTDDEAVSPVIGVILMVAITVILAAVIGTFVLGLGDQVQSTSPQASFNFDFDSSGTATDFSTAPGGASEGTLTVTHDGGDKITADNLNIAGSSVEGSNVNYVDDGPYSAGSAIVAGETVDIGVADSDTIRVTWSSESGDSTATLGKWSGPEA